MCVRVCVKQHAHAFISVLNCPPSARQNLTFRYDINAHFIQPHKNLRQLCFGVHMNDAFKRIVSYFLWAFCHFVA